MRKLFMLVKREYLASIKTKGFIIGLIIAPVFMSGSLIVFAIMKDRVDTTDKKIAVMDHPGNFYDELYTSAEQRNASEVIDEESGKKIKPVYDFVNIDLTDKSLDDLRLELSDDVRDGDLHAFLEISSGVINPSTNQNSNTISYYAKNAAMDDVRDWLSWPINRYLRELRLKNAGINSMEIPDLFSWINVDPMGLVDIDKDSGEISDAEKSSKIEAILVPIIMMMMMFMMMMMSVPGMLHSVMEEKTQRIAEVLLGSVTPFEFMMGKVLGGIAVALTSSMVYVIGGVSVVFYMDYQHFVPLNILPWLFIYLILAVVMMGSLSAALGSTCSEAKDAQSLTFPSMLPMMVPMFVYFPVVREPLSSFSTVLSLIPPFTPLLMLLRQATPESIPVWQPIAGLIGVILMTLIFVWAGGRIFRIAILMQGTPPKFSNIIKWAFRG